jgi:hypothetical protein
MPKIKLSELAFIKGKTDNVASRKYERKKDVAFLNNYTMLFSCNGQPCFRFRLREYMIVFILYYDDIMDIPHQIKACMRFTLETANYRGFYVSGYDHYSLSMCVPTKGHSYHGTPSGRKHQFLIRDVTAPELLIYIYTHFDVVTYKLFNVFSLRAICIANIRVYASETKNIDRPFGSIGMSVPIAD